MDVVRNVRKQKLGIQQILGDPQMRSILQEMQTDPKKANAAMQDPDISAKLQKLIAAGVLQVR